MKEESIMIKRCIGCGTKLQQTNSNEPGYTPKTDAKYCMRCFKMNNYGVIKPEKVNKNNHTCCFSNGKWMCNTKERRKCKSYRYKYVFI